MGTTFVVMTALKLGAVGVLGISLSSAFSFFHNYEWKPKSNKDKKEKGDSNGSTNVGDDLRKQTRSAN